METTELLYLTDFTLLQFQSHILELEEQDGQRIVYLDRTAFYPQGGGQPYDQGMMQSQNGQFQVREVRFLDGVVKHIGVFQQGSFNTGEMVEGYIDTIRRALNSKLHSAGHIVDMAISRLGMPWTPGKAFHFPEGAYVEYTGELKEEGREQLKAAIEQTCNAIIAESLPVHIQFLKKDAMQSVCHYVPDNIPTNKPSRVILFGTFGIPCGGTHVQNLSDLGHMTVRKVKNEKGSIRVSYDIDR